MPTGAEYAAGAEAEAGKLWKSLQRWRRRWRFSKLVRDEAGSEHGCTSPIQGTPVGGGEGERVMGGMARG